jgi:hypothetical protein
MKNKSTLTLFTFFLLLSHCFVVSAQKQKSNNDFTLTVIEQSKKPNYKKEHIHVLELKNNSGQMSEYAITVVTNNCSDKKNNTLQNIKSTNPENSNIKTQLFLNDLNRAEWANEVLKVKPNASVKLFLKTLQNNNAVLDSWNCTDIQITKLSNKTLKGSKNKKSESVIIKTFVPNPNSKGH